MELPPLPSFEAGEAQGFGTELPPLPETSLPPLPSEMPSLVPEAPEEKKIEAPKMMLPEAPQPTITEQKKVEARPVTQETTFPTIPELPTEEFVPEKIPPLENIPEAPAFTEAPKEFAPRQIEIEDVPVYALREEMPKARERRGPLFVRSDGFKAIADDIEQIRAKFKEEDDIFFRVTEVKNAQDQKYEAFRLALEDMQRKLLFIDRTLFENR
jgi:hypothetical protein